MRTPRALNNTVNIIHEVVAFKVTDLIIFSTSGSPFSGQYSFGSRQYERQPACEAGLRLDLLYFISPFYNPIHFTMVNRIDYLRVFVLLLQTFIFIQKTYMDQLLVSRRRRQRLRARRMVCGLKCHVVLI